MPFVSRRILGALTVTTGLVISVCTPVAQAAPGGGSAGGTAHNVIVVLRNQHTDLAMGKGATSARVEANRRDVSSQIAHAKQVGARNLRGFSSISAFAATATPTQVSELASNPSVAAVYPDLQIKGSPVSPAANAAAAPGDNAPQSGNICPTDPAKPLLEPEALQVTNTAFNDPSTPQAQNIVNGAGVKVAFIADGLDINNPDFIRANGSHVFTDYQDFSGDGLAAPTGAAEAFGDASAIAAQGRQVYDLANFVNPAHPLPPGCNITVRGMAPGASLVGLKVFGNSNTAPTSRFIEAIDYAVNVAKVDIINESFGANPFPDNGNDPITLADEAAVAAGVSVTSSTGDAGTTGTVGSPSSSPDVIGVAATTTFRSYIQTTGAGAQLSNGTWENNNISGLSSGGITQQARVPDLAAPGDLGWALCTPDLDLYEECTTDGGGPSPIQDFGGTSQSSPLTAGAAALVIEAYEQTHHGVRPSPAQVKMFLTSTATDEGHPAYEQGAGLLNALGAVQAAKSWKDNNGSPSTHSSNLVVNKSQLSVIGDPGSNHSTSLSVRNVSNQPRLVQASTRTLGRTVSSVDRSTTLNSATAPTYLDAFGILRAFASKPFSVPNHADRLIVSAAAAANAALRIILIDPHGVFTAYSIPQGVNNFANVDVHYPVGGTWTAFFAIPQAAPFNGTVKYNVTAADFTTEGTVSPTSRVIAPGATANFTVHSRLSQDPGDLSASVQFTSAGLDATSVPLTLRSQVPAHNTTFTQTVTGGNGRQQLGPAQSNNYYLKVPSGKRDLSVAITFQDPQQIVFGVLTGPDGQVASYQSNADVDSGGNLVAGQGLQLYRRDPKPGVYVLSLDVTNPVSGLELRQEFRARVAYNTVSVHASLPQHGRLTAGVPVNVPVRITNTGPVAQTYFADGRLDTIGTVPLAELSGNSTNIPLPVPAGVNPQWLVPPDMRQLTTTATADQPVNLDFFYNSGEPDVYSAAQGNGATVQVNAAQVSPGLWIADVGQSGPFNGPAPSGQVSLSASAVGRLFDPDLTSSTGDVWQAGVDPSANPAAAAAIRAHGPTMSLRTGASAKAEAGPAADPAPVTLNPGQSTTITVTITPSGAHGSKVSGRLFVDSFNFFTSAGDELIDLPYSYTVR